MIYVILLFQKLVFFSNMGGVNIRILLLYLLYSDNLYYLCKQKCKMLFCNLINLRSDIYKKV